MNKHFWYTPFILLLYKALSAGCIDVSEPLRIESLLPLKNRMYCLPIDPSIPDDFVVLSPNRDGGPSLIGELDDDNFYWGRKNVLLSYFQNPSNLSEPIFRFGLSPYIAQPNYGYFDEEALKKECTKFSKSTQAELFLDFNRWQDTPYFIVRGVLKDTKMYAAYIGLNHESGAVLHLHLLLPQNATPQIHQQASELWEKFFHNSKPLPEPLFYKAHGQELHTGFTLVRILDRTIKIIAERRKSDRHLRFAVIPLDPDVEFKFDSSEITYKGREWRFGDSVFKIKGVYYIDKGWVTLCTTNSVFIKDVDEFSTLNIFKPNIFIKEMPVNLDPLFSMEFLKS